MPPVFHVDSYEECMQDPEGVYCMAQVALVADGHSPLMDLITEYSAHTVCHYNHSLLRYNLCITNTCKEFYDNTTTDLVHVLEACLNKTFEDNYGLKTKLSEINVHCKKVHEEIQVEIADLCMFALLFGILMVNTVGSLYDFICTNGKNGEGIPILTSFSIRRNWRKLVATPLRLPDSRLDRLKGLSCAKFILTAGVILAHTTVCSFFYIDNTQFIEDLYKNFFFLIIVSGTVIMQTFFLISGFLLSFNLELKSESSNFKVNWMLIPKGILLRWIRLTPVYAFVLFYIVTINKYMIVTGPHWHYAAADEIEDCKRYWWQHLLYINNYNAESHCMLHTWYIASDIQLCFLALLIYVMCRSACSRKVVLSLLLVISIVIPVAHTYWQDLNGMMISSPELILRLFVGDPTFTHLYSRGHTNMFSYLLGVSIGFLAYHAQKINFDAQKLKKYRVLFYSMITLGVALTLCSGIIFYRDGPRPPLAVRMLFAAFQKPVWSLLFGVVMLAVIFTFEGRVHHTSNVEQRVAVVSFRKTFLSLLQGMTRDVVEWNGWRPLSQLSYCAYFLHVPVLRILISFNDMTHVTYISMIEHTLFTLTASHLAALPTWLLVEQPATQLLSSLLRRPPKDAQHNTTGVTKENIKEEDKKHTFDEQIP